MAAIERTKVLHLIGSTKDEWYHDLSFVYSRACDGCKDLDRVKFDFHYAHVHLDGMWSFPTTLGEEDVEKAYKMPIASAIAHIMEISPDVMVPHMFCNDGMTWYRTLFDLLKIPFLGNHEYSVWPATDKATTKQLLEAAGVQVPKGDLLVKGRHEVTSIKAPCVVKPCNEDNSHGITFVKKDEDFEAALKYAFTFDDRVVVDEYIAGRELRVACVEEEDGSLTVLPKLEYFLTDIRTSAHKLKTNDDGKLSKNAVIEAKKDGDRQCPADVSPTLEARLDDMVKTAHRALKCRHYSLFDVRVDKDEQPFFLEACLFCSFSPVSVIPSMASHCKNEHLRHPNFFQNLLVRTAAEKPKPTGTRAGGYAAVGPLHGA